MSVGLEVKNEKLETKKEQVISKRFYIESSYTS